MAIGLLCTQVANVHFCPAYTFLDCAPIMTNAALWVDQFMAKHLPILYGMEFLCEHNRDQCQSSFILKNASYTSLCQSKFLNCMLDTYYKTSTKILDCRDEILLACGKNTADR